MLVAISGERATRRLHEGSKEFVRGFVRVGELARFVYYRIRVYSHTHYALRLSECPSVRDVMCGASEPRVALGVICAVVVYGI